MKERISGLRNESSKTKRTGLFQRITAAFLLNISIFWHINEGIKDIMADYFHQEMIRNFLLGLFEIVPFNRNQRFFLVSRFFSEQIEEPNGLKIPAIILLFLLLQRKAIVAAPALSANRLSKIITMLPLSLPFLPELLFRSSFIPKGSERSLDFPKVGALVALSLETPEDLVHSFPTVQHIGEKFSLEASRHPSVQLLVDLLDAVSYHFVVF